MTIAEPYSLAPEEVRDKLPQIERRLAESERYAPLRNCWPATSRLTQSSGAEPAERIEQQMQSRARSRCNDGRERTYA